MLNKLGKFQVYNSNKFLEIIFPVRQHTENDKI